MQNRESKKKSETLLNCPFCGGDAEVIEGYICWAIECGCGISTIFYDTKEELIEYWNARKPMDSIVEQLEEASKIFCREYALFEDENVLYLPDAIEIVKEGGK